MDKEDEEEKEEKQEKRVRRGGARWQRGVRHVENVSQPPCILVATPLSFLHSSLTQISSRNITIVNNYYYGSGGRGGNRQGNKGHVQGKQEASWGQH